MNLQNKAIKQPLRPKHIPERSCIACRNKNAKKGLIRLVCCADGVKVDPGKKRGGRGAYLCPKRECWETGLTKNRLEYALRTRLSQENRQILIEFGRNLPEKEIN